MFSHHKLFSSFFLVLCTAAVCLAQDQPVELTAEVGTSFRFAFFSDSRFTDPKNTRDSNASVRETLVRAITEAHPAFVSIGGDIVYHGDDANDWKTWDAETAAWRENHIPVYPVLGNHDLSGGKLALEQYFQRFPELKNSRYYSVRAGNALLLVLDSSLSEVSGPQGEWLVKKLDSLPSDVEFVLVLLHHPPYTSSSDEKEFGGGHSARSEEQQLGSTLENGKRPCGCASRFSLGMFTITSAMNMMASHILSVEEEGRTLTAFHERLETYLQTTRSTIIFCWSRSNEAG
jgi:Calcineurin-like phosphoesterase